MRRLTRRGCGQRRFAAGGRPQQGADDAPRRRDRQPVAESRQRVDAREAFAGAHVARGHHAHGEVARRADGDQRHRQRLAGGIGGDALGEIGIGAERGGERGGEFTGVAGDGGEFEPARGRLVERRADRGPAAEFGALRGEQDRPTLLGRRLQK